MLRRILPVVLFAFGCVGRSEAGSVITTNLPSNVSIVNINAQQDGAANFNGGSTGQALWYTPFSASGAGSLLTLPLNAGTYTFSIINPQDAATRFPGLTGGQVDSIYSAWTYNSPWVTQYFVFDISSVTNSSIPQLFDGAAGTVSFNNPQDAYSAAVSGGYTNRIRLTSQQTDPAHPGREGSVFTTSLTLTSATTLVFAIPDNGLGDNGGGVSVVVTTVPEPGVTALCIAAGGLLVAAWRRKRA